MRIRFTDSFLPDAVYELFILIALEDAPEDIHVLIDLVLLIPDLARGCSRRQIEDCPPAKFPERVCILEARAVEFDQRSPVLQRRFGRPWSNISSVARRRC